MIISNRQLITTQEKIKELQESLKKIKKGAPLAQSSKIQIQALIRQLQNEIHEYEELRSKGLSAIELNDLSEIMLLPIKYRLAKKMTQESFAKEVDVPLRLIARYEAEGYRNIAGKNLYKIFSKLHLKILGRLIES